MLLSVIYNILWIILAYFIGSINFSLILTSLNKNKENIKNVGSKNAVATNAARVYGIKFGLIIFFFDASKSFWLAFTVGLLQKNNQEFSMLIPQLITLFVIIGHIFPIYFDFKGGKGSSALLGMIASISLILAAIGAVLFLIVVSITKYISFGSIVVPYWLAALAFIHPYLNGWYDSVISYGDFWFSPVMLFIGSAIISISHYQNIQRIFTGTERKISLDFIEKQKNI